LEHFKNKFIEVIGISCRAKGIRESGDIVLTKTEILTMILGDEEFSRGSNPSCQVAGGRERKENRVRRFAHDLRRDLVFFISPDRNPLKSLDSEK
jgi:hypothetical protein